jgi:PleD family two-component response regulator
MSQRRVLVISDDPAINDEVRNGLNKITDEARNKIYDVLTITRTHDFIGQTQQWMPYVIVLDTSLTDYEAHNDPIFKAIRAVTRISYIPMIFLIPGYADPGNTFREDVTDDDYIAKPFDIHELILRVRYSADRTERNQTVDKHTGLAGHYPLDCILKDIFRFSDDVDPWTYIDLKLNESDPLKQTYVAAPGDHVLETTRILLNRALIEHGTPDDFLGYMDDDNFAIITFAKSPEALLNYINDHLLNEINLQWEGMIQGRKEKLRLKLGVGTVSSTDEGFATPTELLAIAAYRRK